MADNKEYVGLFFKKENYRKHGRDNIIAPDFNITPCIAQHCLQESLEKCHIHKYL